MKKILSLIIISLFFSGNVNSAPQDGKGELKLSYNAAMDFINYIRGGVGFGAKASNNKPMVYYVTVDGSGSYFWYCPYGQCRSGNAKEEMILCERAYKKECKRFARGKQVRWDNGINPIKGSASKFHETMTDDAMLAKLTDLGFYGNTSSSSTTINKNKKKKIEIKKTPKNDDNKDIVKQLKDLKEMYDNGALTKEEYEKAKKKLLN